MIETWGFYFFNSGRAPGAAGEPSPEELQRAFDRYLQLWIACEDYGFDGLAFAEHHFNPGCLSPSTHLLVPAVARATRRLRFTTLGSVLPLTDARRFVEEIGMLDYLTGGRYEPGIAPGAGDRDAVMTGMPVGEIRPRYYSGADVLLKATEGPTVTQHDEFYDLEQVPMVPRMRERTGRSIWTTATSAGSAAWAARRGHKMCTGFLPTAAASAVADRYRAAAEESGRAVDPSALGLRRRVFVADTDDEARDKYRAAVDVLGGAGLEDADEHVRALVSEPDDFAVGSPETVTERLLEQCRAGGYGAVMAWTDFALFDHADLVRSHELIGSRVAPVLRAATSAAEPTTAA